MIMVEVKGNDVINIINGARRLDIQIQVNGVAIATDSKTKKEVQIIKDKFDNLKVKK